MFSIYSRKMDAARLYILLRAASSLFFSLVFTVSMIYQVQTVGLSPLQLVLVGTTLEIAAFMFEVPTGVVADVYSRRLSVVIGFSLIGLGFIVEGSVPVFGAVLLAQVLWGLGYTFTSGATEAWITDEVGQENVGPIFLRASQIGSLAGIVGTLIAALLGAVLINLPMIVGGLLFICMSIFFILVMPETGFKRASEEERSTWGHMTGTFRSGVRQIRGRPVLMAILGIGLFFGLYSEGYDRLTTAHLLQSFTLPDFGGLQPVIWLSGLGMIGQLLTAIATRVVSSRLDTRSGRALARASLYCSGLLITALLGFALSGSFYLTVVCWWGVSILRDLIGPIKDTWVNQNVDSSVRATVISMNSQVDALGQIVGGPPVGLIGGAFGIRAALVASGLILSPVLYLYSRFLRQDRLASVPTVALDESGTA